MEEYLNLDIDCEMKRFRRSIENSDYSFRFETPTQKIERINNILKSVIIAGSETSSVSKILSKRLENKCSLKQRYGKNNVKIQHSSVNMTPLLKNINYNYKTQEDALI